MKALMYIAFFFAMVSTIANLLDLIKNIIAMSKMDESMFLLSMSDTTLLNIYKVIVTCLLWTAFLISTNVL